jgi:murein DD-endopeptidase MepM/ murein hydrolase activator NlpD
LLDTLLHAAASLFVLFGPPEAPLVSVPFGCGLAFPVSQAHNTGSHVQFDRWAWDFRMPAGTPVLAALDGTVRLARGDSTDGGCDPQFAPKANYVVLEHGQGLETQYLHLQKVVVTPGARVKAGDLLGYSGSTGWACGAHLHFKVTQRENDGWNNPSIPAVLAGYGDPGVDTVIRAPACQLASAQR